MIVTVNAGSSPPSVTIAAGSGTLSAAWRVTADGSRTLVRGGAVSGVIDDYECPQETPVTYVTNFQPGGVGIETSSVVEMPDVGVWLIPPADVASSVMVRVGDRGVTDLVMAGGMSVASIPGRTEPVAVTWRRQSLAGSLECVTLDVEEFDGLVACLNAPGPLLVSSPWRVGPLRGVTWVVIGDAKLEQLDRDGDAYRFTLPFTPVSRPAFTPDSSQLWSAEGGSWNDAGVWNVGA